MNNKVDISANIELTDIERKDDGIYFTFFMPTKIMIDQLMASQKYCQGCGNLFTNKDPRARYCTNACKQKHFRERKANRSQPG